MELVIKRSEWIHNEGDYASYLLRPADSKKCCLGFYALSCGVAADAIEYKPAPFDIVPEKRAAQMNWLLGGEAAFNSNDAYELMLLNDYVLGSEPETWSGEGHPPLTEQEREDRIAAIFSKHDVQVTFVD